MINKLEEILSPIGAKLGNQRHLQAISSGMMMSLALIVVGSLFSNYSSLYIYNGINWFIHFIWCSLFIG